MGKLSRFHVGVDARKSGWKPILRRGHTRRCEGNFHQRPGVARALDGEGGAVRLGERLGERQAEAGGARAQRVEVASWRNGSSADSISFSLMPTPVSRTRSTAPRPPAAVETITCPPAPVNLIEFDKRLSTIWRIE